MILFINENNRITAYSKTKTVEELKEYIDSGKAVEYDSEFDFFMGEDREGFEKQFYYENGEVRTEYIEISQEPLSKPLFQTEQTLMHMAINMEYLTTMMELKQ